MRILIRLLLGVLVLLLLGIGGLALFLPRLVNGPAVRSRIESAARAATGRDFAYGDVTVGFVPPRLVVTDPMIAGPSATSEPFLRADSVSLQLALGPLLARVLLVDSLVVDGARLRVVRTKAGFDLPAPATDAGAPAGPAGASSADAESSAAADFSLAVRDLVLRKIQIVVLDQTVAPPVTLQLEDAELRAKVRSLEEPIDFELSGALASGGGFRGSGTASLAGDVDLALNLEGVETGAFAPYLEATRKIDGRVKGRVDLRANSDSVQSVDAALQFDARDLRIEDVEAQGLVTVNANLDGAPLTGSFEMDATAADLSYGGGAFRKTRGTPATVTGRLRIRSGGNIDIEGFHLRIRNLDAKGKVELGDRIQMELSVPPFELAGWDDLVGALSGLGIGGTLELRDFRVATPPLNLAGRVQLAGVRVTPPDGAPVVMNGSIQASGTMLNAEWIQVTAAGQPLQLSGQVANLATQPSYRLNLNANQVDSRALLAAYTSMTDEFEGPLTVLANLNGPLGGPLSVAETVSGDVTMEVGQGRIRGVSLLEGAFDQIGSIANAALIFGHLQGGKTLQRFYEDEFESIRGTWRIDSGLARTNDLTLKYRHYTVDLRGTLGLADQKLAFTGNLTIDEQLDETLAGTDSGARAGTRSTKRVIPLAQVTGTLQQPRVRLTPEAVMAFASSYALGSRRSKVQEQIDERLGKGSGEAVLDALGGILGGGKRQ